jgi:hypothetical protein
MKQKGEDAEAEGFVRGFNSIPEDDKLRALSFVELAEELSRSPKDSTRYMTIDRELKKRLAADQAKINRTNVYAGALMSGLFGLAGVFLGWWLRDVSSMHQPAPSNAMQQIQQGVLGVKSQHGVAIVEANPSTEPTLNVVAHPKR